MSLCWAGMVLWQTSPAGQKLAVEELGQVKAEGCYLGYIQARVNSVSPALASQGLRTPDVGTAVWALAKDWPPRVTHEFITERAEM